MNLSQISMLLAVVLAYTIIDGRSGEAGSMPEQQAAAPKAHPVDVPVDVQLVAAQNAFGLRLFGALAKRDGDQNTFVSPTSAALALALAYNGAEGRTKDEIATAMAVQGISLDQFNQSNAALLARLAVIDPKVKLHIANSIWVRESGSLRPQPNFVKRCHNYYSAEMGDLRGAPGSVNAWVRRQTEGKIDSLVRESDLQNVVAILANAVYFKGEWTDRFEKSATQSAVFTLVDGTKRDVPMMHRNLKCPYLRGDRFQAISVPYGSGRVRALLFLPDIGTKITDFLTQLTAENWSQWTSRFHPGEGSLGLPRFRSDNEADLEPALKALGMGTAFQAIGADFSGLAGSPGEVWIGKAVQKTYVEVNEEGTEAAAATGIVMRARAMRRTERFDLTFDRPFLFAVQDSMTGAVLFVGQIVDPRS